MYTKSKKRVTWTWVLVTVVILVTPAHAQNSVTGGQPTASVSVLDSTKDQDGLVGSVRRVKIQSAKLEVESGQLREGQLQLLEITTYGLNGDRIDNASYPVGHSSVGKEEYKYNDKGNIIEMTLRSVDGSILSREKYEYEFDTFGNWKKMVTSLVLFENGELRYEPVEVTYREIAYYYDDSVANLVKSVSPRTAPPPASDRLSGFANLVGPDLQTGIMSHSDRPIMIDLDGEPPEPSNALSAGVRRSTVSAANETANTVPPASKMALAYYEKGREYSDLGALKEAVESYQRSLELEPQRGEVYLSLGDAYFRLKNYKEAGKAFKQATQLNPEMAEAHYGLGLHYFVVNRYKNAADAFNRATLLRPDMGKAHYGLALAYQELGKLDGMIAELRILETLDPSLAKKLSDTVPQFNLPCRVPAFCK